jgi:LemA protein
MTFAIFLSLQFAIGFVPRRTSGKNFQRGFVTMTTMILPRTLRAAFTAVILIAASAILSGCGFNTIPTAEEQAKAAWSQVLNQYQRRADLIPNLVETVKGFAAQEKDVLEGVVEARSKATQVQVPADILTNPEAFKTFQENQSAITGSLGRLLAIAEAYPDLKSNQNFLALQDQIEGTENQIAVARRDYIEAVRVYNTSLKTLPSAIWAYLWWTNNNAYETFTVAQDKMEVPAVKF